MKRLFKTCQWLVISTLTLFIATGCKNQNYKTNIDEQSCFITPELKKVLKDYLEVIQVDKRLIIVSSKATKVDETGRNYNPMGCIDMKGNVVIPTKYERITIWDRVFCVSKYTKQGMRYGLLDMEGHEILPIEYEEIFGPDVAPHNYIRIKKNGLYGLVDKKGKALTPIQYDNVNRFYVNGANLYYKEEELPDIYIAWKNKKHEIINLSPDKTKNKPSTPYDVVLIGEYGNQSFMDYQGHIIAGPYQNVRVSGDSKIPLFPEGLAAVVKNSKIGFIDMQGKVKIPFKFYYSEYWFNITAISSCVFSEGLAAMMNSGKKWGYIDKQGNTIVPFQYNEASRFHEGVAIVGNTINNEARYGLINKYNKVILPFEFETGTFTGNVYAMCKNGKWGVYSPEGRCIVPCQYDKQICFFKGYATVHKDEKQGLINEQGQLLIPCQYDACLYDMKTDLAFVIQDGKQGFVDLQNHVVVPIEFDFANACHDNTLFLVKKGDRQGLYDLCGNCTLE